MINVRDFETIKAELKEYFGAPEWEELEAKYCGPGTGIYFDEKKDEIVVANDWTIDENGDVVPCSNFGSGVFVNEGPGVE